MPNIRRTLVLTALLGVAVLALGAGPALASKCGDQVIDDWFKDGRIDKTYALHCYDDALDQLPNDVETYSDAPQVIKRALQQALANNAPVETNGGSGGSGDDGGTGSSGGQGGNGGGDGPGTTTPSPSGPSGTPDPGEEQALGPDSSSNASSVPVPLIVLAGLALLLLAAGGAGYLNRRLQARRVDGGPDDLQPPADV